MEGAQAADPARPASMGASRQTRRCDAVVRLPTSGDALAGEGSGRIQMALNGAKPRTAWSLLFVAAVWVVTAWALWHWWKS